MAQSLWYFLGINLEQQNSQIASPLCCINPTFMELVSGNLTEKDKNKFWFKKELDMKIEIRL